MISALAAFLLALVWTATFTPIVRRMALAVGAVDEPGARRVHAHRIPRMGGVAIAAGFFFSLLTLSALRTHALPILYSKPRAILGMTIGAVVLAAAGVIDDIRTIGAKNKLKIQVIAAIIAYACGTRIEGIELPGIGAVQLGWLAFPATLAWIIGVVNAINLIDGLDGLAAGVVFFASLTNFVIGYLTGNVFIELISACLGGSVIGFLFYNFNPARIFMGDTGSMFLGYILATASLLGAGTQKSPTLIAILVPILALGLPIVDLLLTIVRRFLGRRSLFTADREHIHHRLLDLGLTHRRAVLTLYLLSIAFTSLALAVYFGRSWQVGAALLALTILMIGFVRFVGHLNTSLVSAGRSTGDELAGRLRVSVPRSLRRMDRARSIDDLPSLLADFAVDSGLVAVDVLSPQSQSLRTWRWASPQAGGRASRDAVCAKFTVGHGERLIEVQFFVDSAAGIIGPQTTILLQLVADAAEAMMVPRSEPVQDSTPTPDRIPGERPEHSVVPGE